jgi:glycosyl transferase, family 25
MVSKSCIYYINLDADLSRRKNIEKQFSSFSIDACRFSAISWKKIPESMQSKYYSQYLNNMQYHSTLVNGEKGCYLSHILVWQKFLKSDATTAFVLEDDALINKDFEIVKDAISELKIPWDMIKLIGRDNEKIRSRCKLITGYEIIEYSRIPSYTTGYAISRSGAQKLLESRIPFGRPIDIDLRFWWENNLCILGVFPHVIKHNDISQISSITGRKSKNSIRSKLAKLRMKAALLVGNILHLNKQRKLLRNENNCLPN